MQDDRRTTGPRASDHASISSGSGAENRNERRGAEPDAGDLRDPQEVWADSQTSPRPDGGTTGMPGRVADPGDLGKANPQPYATETQADALARQTRRDGDERPPVKPAR
ncbi:hypothetical protein [Aquibium microcysteis]|uniref:hypothetical protein n=1 Tax=Aquibium microcysteis TaxID=675281 RepID=UPI00165D13E1|nr:hypothetical protein [Aquibium microcysteis]